ncbi:MAG: LPS export ABC transporter periplasmic protein LptC [Nitrospirae bacterium]|nr:LPS export ABC transporter periplasmic protein LptC [Nitrospirota bacterium]
MKIRFLSALSIILLLGALIIYNRYKEDGLSAHTLYRTSSMQGFHLIHKEGGRIGWELIADSAIFPQGNNEVLLKDLNMKIYQDQFIILTGKEGNYSIDEKILVVDKTVEVKIDNSVLNTDSLIWDGNKEVITTQDNIKFRGKTFSIEGRGLTVIVKDQQVKVLNDVKGIFYR